MISIIGRRNEEDNFNCFFFQVNPLFYISLLFSNYKCYIITIQLCNNIQFNFIVHEYVENSLKIFILNFTFITLKFFRLFLNKFVFLKKIN